LNHPEHTGGYKNIKNRDTGKEVYPTPFHVLQFIPGRCEPDNEINKEEKANAMIDIPKQFGCFGRQVAKRINEQCNYDIYRQYQYQDIEWMNRLPLLKCYTHDKQF
jgi:hypothetical protein